MKQNIKESYSMGHYDGMALVPNEPIILKLPSHIGVSVPLSDRSSYTMGDASVKEGEEPLDPERDDDIDPNDLFAEKIKKIVSNAVMGVSIPGKLKGHKDIVATVGKLINAEKKYIKDLLYGKSATDPIMIKEKELINKTASELKRMSGLIWPFL